MSKSPAAEPSSQDDFTTTRWSMVIAAGDRASAESQEALESLCQTYWYPLYAYVRRRVGDVAEAEDLTQSFFTTLLEKNHVAVASQQRGQFRAFLLTALKHFLSNQWRRAHAIKRGGGRTRLPLDFQSADSRFQIEPASRLTPEEIYDRQWALTLLDRTLTKLQDEFAAMNKSEQFNRLKGFVIGDSEAASYREVAEQLQTTEAAAKMAASRMRTRYRQLLREEIKQTVASAEHVEDEIRELFVVLGS